MNQYFYILIIFTFSTCPIFQGCSEKSNAPVKTISEANVEFSTINLMALAGDTFFLTQNDFNGLSFESLFIKGDFGIDSTTEHQLTHIGESFKRAGFYQVLGVKNDEIFRIANIHVKAANPTGQLFSVLGPKSIHQNEKSEALYFPTDAFGNPSGRNHLLVRNLAADNRISTASTIINNHYYSDTIHASSSPRIIAGASMNLTYSKEKQIRVLSGCPTEATINLDQYYKVADGRQFFNVNTNVLKDKLGMTVENGTTVEFQMINSEGISIARYTSYTLNGIASSWIKNPSYAGYYTLEGKICDVTFEVDLGYFENLIEKFEYEWEGNTISAGPITSSLGQYIPNGIQAILHVNSTEKVQKLKSEINNGYVIFDLDKLWMNQAPVTADLEINGRIFNLKVSAI